MKPCQPPVSCLDTPLPAPSLTLPGACTSLPCTHYFVLTLQPQPWPWHPLTLYPTVRAGLGGPLCVPPTAQNLLLFYLPVSTPRLELRKAEVLGSALWGCGLSTYSIAQINQYVKSEIICGRCQAQKQTSLIKNPSKILISVISTYSHTSILTSTYPTGEE